MNEIFGDQEMALFHRVAMEMEHADREKNSDKYELGGPGTEIIRLDDDSEMEDASRVVVRMDSTRGVIQSKFVVPSYCCSRLVKLISYLQYFIFC